MLIKRKMFINLILLFFFSLLYCKSQDSNITHKYVFNDKPLYREGEFIKLEKLHNIELISDKYEISKVYDMDADNDQNLYVLSRFESTVTIFNENGNYIKTMGQPGQGPRDLMNPILLSFYENKLYILQEPISIKIWNTNGEYLQNIPISVDQYSLIRPIKNNFMVLSWIASNNDKFLKYSFFKASKDFRSKNILFEYELNRDTEFYFNPAYALAINRNNQFYFPEKSNTYKIFKYDDTGKPMMSFGKDYNRIPFSKEARNIYNKAFGDAFEAGKLSDLPKFPPVVRKVFLDARENIWIVSGEITEDHLDLGDKGVEVSIDIFNEDGKWLYTFRHDDNEYIYKSFIKNDRLYTVSIQSSITGQQYINVYKIHYNY